MSGGQGASHSLAFRVMRLCRPSFQIDHPLVCDPLDLMLGEDFLDNESAIPTSLSTLIVEDQSKEKESFWRRFELENPMDAMGLSGLLVLPQAFGAIYLGETFCSYISVGNHSSFEVRDVVIKAEIQTERQRLVLSDTSKSPIESIRAGGRYDFIIEHDIKELGPHTLVCMAVYIDADGERKHLPQFFKFVVANPLSVRTKVRSVKDSTFLEACIENHTKSHLYMDQVQFEPAQPWTAKVLTADDAKIEVDPHVRDILKAPDLIRANGGIRNYIYQLTQSSSESTAVKVEGSNTLGKLQITWRTNLGEPGRLQTQNILGNPILHKEVDIQIVELPPHIILDRPFLDVDCFYAQTEVLKNPHLRARPVGITQKFLVVTCNYLARQRGVPKMASIEEAQRRCPDIVLINGEDLTPYRAASRGIMNVLRRFGTLERSGLDECSLDITSETKKRASLGSFTEHFVGFVIGLESAKKFEKEHLTDETASTGCKLGHLIPYSASESKFEGVSASVSNISSGIENELHTVSSDGRNLLMVGSHLVAEIRAIVEAETGFQCSCGISYNKMLAKMVSSANKPNKQTCLLQSGVLEFLCPLSVRKLPGVGHRTESMLVEIGIKTVADLQTCSLHQLLQMFGEKMGHFLLNACRGVDMSPVRDKGPQKSVSVEDSFPPCTSLKRIECIVSSLASDFMARLDEDRIETGRAPQVFTIKWRQKGNGNFTSASTQMPAEMLSSKCPMDRRKQILVQTGMSLVSRSLRGHSFSVVVLNIGATNFTDTSRGISSASKDIRSLLQNSTKMQETCTTGKDEIMFRNVVETDHSRNSQASPSLFGQRLNKGSMESSSSGELVCKSSLELRKAVEEQCERNDMTKLNTTPRLEDGDDDVCRPFSEDATQITVSNSFIYREDYFREENDLAEENSGRKVLSFPCEFEKQTGTADSGNLESRACVSRVSVDIESNPGETSLGSLHVQGGNRELGSTRKRGLHMQENNIMGSFVCEKCGQKVGCEKQQKQEHDDYHYALELHSKDTNDWRKQNNLLARNPYPKKRNQNLTLDSFFSRPN